jgi:hypothetical protein
MTKLYILNGPEIGKSFDLEKNTVYIGRSSDNDIQILDKTVSRRHMKIRRAGNKYFITDLKSQNETFFKGNYLSPGIELEVEEGVPIVIGMSVICIGKGCMEQVGPFLDSIELTKEIDERSGIFTEKREKTNQKKLELIYKVSDILMEEDIKEILEKTLDYIFEFLNRVDRGVIVICDPVIKATREVFYRSKRPDNDTNTIYCKDVLDRVLKEEKAVVIPDARVEMEDEITDTLKNLKIESVMCVPLMGTSKIMGALYVDSLNRPYGFRNEDLSLFNDIGRRTAVAIEYASLTTQL